MLKETTWSRALDLLLPSLCPACDEPLALDSVLHPSCWKSLRFVSRPYCEKCALPLLTARQGMHCAACFENPPPWQNARSAILFKDIGRDLVLRFKYGDHIENSALFADWMINAGRDLLEDKPVIVPVPLHWKRLLSRRYNQACELGRVMAKKTSLPFVSDLLLRHKETARQSRLRRTERLRNVKGAFMINPKRAQWLKHKSFLLIDDVMTSGATLRENTHILKRHAPNATVHVLTLAIAPP